MSTGSERAAAGSPVNAWRNPSFRPGRGPLIRSVSSDTALTGGAARIPPALNSQRRPPRYAQSLVLDRHDRRFRSIVSSIFAVIPSLRPHWLGFWAVIALRSTTAFLRVDRANVKERTPDDSPGS